MTRTTTRKCCTYDVILTPLTGACPISAFEKRPFDVIRTAFTFYVRVTKGLYYFKTITVDRLLR